MTTEPVDEWRIPYLALADTGSRQKTTPARGGGGGGRRCSAPGGRAEHIRPWPDNVDTTPLLTCICKFNIRRPFCLSANAIPTGVHVAHHTGIAVSPYPDGVTAKTPNAAQPGRVAAFFDLDKTIIAKSSTLAFSKPFFDQGLINRRSVLKSSYAQFLFLLSGADHDQMERMRAYLTSMCTGWNVEQVTTIVAETLHDIVDPLVFAEAADLIADHKLRGHDVVVVSASGEEVVEPIAEMLGATHSIATRMAVADGCYTGDVEFYCYGPGKVVAMEQLAAEQGYDLTSSYAYSDSFTDAPMLEAVGHPTAVNPDRLLRKLASEKGWPILTFSNPVSLRSRIPAASTRAIATTAAVGIAATVAGALTFGMLRHKR